MARRKKKDPVEEMFTLDTQEPESEGSEVNEKGNEPSVSDLMAQITALSTRLERAEKTNMALMTQPAQTYEPTAVKQTQEMSFEGLPDPSLEPERYAKEVVARAQKLVQTRMDDFQSNQTSEQSLQEKARALWTRYSTDYKDYYADDQTKVGYAASLVANDLRTKGVDINRYMFGPGQESYLEDVKQKVVEIFGDPKAKTNQKSENDETEEDDQRSLSIFGGIESGGRPGNARRREEAGDMVKELQEMQLKTGLY